MKLSLRRSVYLLNNRAHFFQQTFGFKGEPRQIERLQGTVTGRKKRKSGLFIKAGLFVLYVALSKPSQAAK